MAKQERQPKAAAPAKRIRIRLKAYDQRLLDRSMADIVEAAKATGAAIAGPIPLPTKIEKYTVLRSPHVDRKSREQFEIRTHCRLIDLVNPNFKAVERLRNLTIPPGVDVKIQA